MGRNDNYLSERAVGRPGPISRNVDEGTDEL